MNDLMDMILDDESPSQISDKIKELLFAKASEKVDEFRPAVSAKMFSDENDENDEE